MRLTPVSHPIIAHRRVPAAGEYVEDEDEDVTSLTPDLLHVRASVKRARLKLVQLLEYAHCRHRGDTLS